MIARILKLFTGILALPVCAGLTATFAALVQELHQTDGLQSLTAFLVGFVLWTFLYLALPRPARSYVLAHELTHAFWASLFGHSVHGIRVDKDNGHVLLSDTNFLITLAPYFFPFYTLCSLLLYWILSLAWDQTPWLPFWMGLIGLTWAFHITFTISALKGEQDDISQNGKLFSYTVIYLGNLLGLMIWLQSTVPLETPDLWDQLVADQKNTWQAVFQWKEPAIQQVTKLFSLFQQ